jgi:hypothetical protein
VSPVRYEPGLYIPEDGILHSHRRENLKSYRIVESFTSYFTVIVINSSVFSDITT